jgi:hypothetical protein
LIPVPLARCAVLKARGEAWSRPVSGGFSERETPLPIPNRAVKPLSADGTWPARAWESRAPPVFLVRRAPCATSAGARCRSSGLGVDKGRAAARGVAARPGERREAGLGPRRRRWSAARPASQRLPMRVGRAASPRSPLGEGLRLSGRKQCVRELEQAGSDAGGSKREHVFVKVLGLADGAAGIVWGAGRGGRKARQSGRCGFESCNGSCRG